MAFGPIWLATTIARTWRISCYEKPIIWLGVGACKNLLVNYMHHFNMHISVCNTPGTLIEDVVAPSCGVVVWTSPPNAVRHAVRFFTGETMESTAASERELQRLFVDPNTRFAVATNLPSDCSTVLYAQVLNATTVCDCILKLHMNRALTLLLQIRAGDATTMWPWTEKIVVAGIYIYELLYIYWWGMKVFTYHVINLYTQMLIAAVEQLQQQQDVRFLCTRCVTVPVILCTMSCK